MADNEDEFTADELALLEKLQRIEAKRGKATRPEPRIGVCNDADCNGGQHESVGPRCHACGGRVTFLSERAAKSLQESRAVKAPAK